MQNSWKYKKSGMSLVEVLVVLGVMSVVALGVSAFIAQMAKSALYIEQKQKSIQLANEIYQFLSINETCSFNFGNTSPAAIDLTSFPLTLTELKQRTLVAPFSINKYEVGGTYINDAIRIKSMKILNFSPILDASGVSTSMGTADFIINFEKVNDSVGVKEFKEQSIKLSITLNSNYNPRNSAGDNIIKTCSASGAFDLIWTRKPNDDIYYNPGNVGIGTPNPSAKLEVKAGSEGQGSPVEAIRIWGPNAPASSNSAQDLKWSFSSAGSTGLRGYRGGSWDTYLQFMTNAVGTGADNPQVRMTISENGNIGIGTAAPLSKVSVNGGLAVGAYAAASAAPGDGIIVSGNVGIGTELTPFPLNVRGDGNLTGNLTVDGVVRPGNATVNRPCAVRGSVAYDTANNLLVVCKNNGLWTDIEMNFDNPVTIQIAVPRNGSRDFSTLPNQFKLCILSTVESGGDDGGGGDRCEVAYFPATKIWKISGNRGNDPAIDCKMLCYLR